MKRRHYHFTRIARRYADLRITDLAPVEFIKGKIYHLNSIKAADIGCGAGRYDIKLYDHLGERLLLTCIDENESMLKELDKSLNIYRGKNYITIKAKAELLPLPDDSMDCIFSFNAVHHFKILDFLQESSRILRKNGHLFIYTRTRSQNKRNIWGRYFPKFAEKEKRLYEINELKETLKKIPILCLDSIEYFKYKRKANLDWLLTQVSNHHYSTFYLLYDKEEFEDSLRVFKENISRHFKNPNKIIWYDENLMMVVKKQV